jgi:hypothetical protein
MATQYPVCPKICLEPDLAVQHAYRPLSDMTSKSKKRKNATAVIPMKTRYNKICNQLIRKILTKLE